MTKSELYQKFNDIDLFGLSEASAGKLNSFLENFIATNQDTEIERVHCLFEILVWNDNVSVQPKLLKLWEERKDILSLLYLAVFQDIYAYVDYQQLLPLLLSAESKEIESDKRGLLEYVLGLVYCRKYTDTGNDVSLSKAEEHLNKSLQYCSTCVRAYVELISLYERTNPELAKQCYLECSKILENKFESIEFLTLDKLDQYYRDEHITGITYYLNNWDLIKSQLA